MARNFTKCYEHKAPFYSRYMTMNYLNFLLQDFFLDSKILISYKRYNLELLSLRLLTSVETREDLFNVSLKYQKE